MNKKVAFGSKPQASPRADKKAEEWVNGGGLAEEPSELPVERAATKRLTFDISVDLHTRVKVQCAQKGVKVADELRTLLEEHFPASSGTEKEA